MITVNDEMVQADKPQDGYLIVKRYLYYRPNSQGYTGIRDEAGRYTLDFVETHYHMVDGVTYIHESMAPEFREAAYSHLVIPHLIKQRDEALTAAISSAPSPVAVREALNSAALIIEGRSTAINSLFIQSLVNTDAYKAAQIIAASDIKLGAEIRALPTTQPEPAVKVDEVRKVLKPIADACETYDGEDQFGKFPNHNDALITLGAARAARDFLNRIGGAE